MWAPAAGWLGVKISPPNFSLLTGNRGLEDNFNQIFQFAITFSFLFTATRSVIDIMTNLFAVPLSLIGATMP
jgi:hypothetical protein